MHLSSAMAEKAAGYFVLGNYQTFDDSKEQDHRRKRYPHGDHKPMGIPQSSWPGVDNGRIGIV